MVGEEERTKNNKAKSRKEKKSRQKLADDDDRFPVPSDPSTAVSGGPMEVDGVARDASGASNKRSLDVDDDELQTQLASQRRQALKKRKKTATDAEPARRA